MYMKRRARRDYDSPPLVEARLAIHFDSARQELLPGLCFQALEGGLPEYELVRKDVEVDQDTAEIRWGSDHLFSNGERNLAVLLGHGYLALIARKPYVGFPEFSRHASDCWDRVKPLLPKPAIHQVRLLYNNVIPLPDHQPNVAALVRGGVFIARDVVASDWEIEHSKADVSFRVSETLTVRLTSQLVGGEQPVMTLNLEAISEGSFVENLATWALEAHELLGDLFEDFLTDELKNAFQPKPTEGIGS